MHIIASSTTDKARLYAIQATSGRRAVVTLERAPSRRYNDPDQIGVSLEGTAYARLYAPAAPLDDDAPPRIADLPGGYATVAAFLAYWEHSTHDQRADLWLWDKEITAGRHNASMKPIERTLPNRHKWKPYSTDDQPRRIAAHADMGDGWYRVYTKDLLAAMKGANVAVRIGTATVKPAIIRQLCRIHRGTVEIKDEGAALGFRTPDTRTRCTIRHGAGDKYAGRNGWERRIVLQRQGHAAAQLAAD